MFKTFKNTKKKQRNKNHKKHKIKIRKNNVLTNATVKSIKKLVNKRKILKDSKASKKQKGKYQHGAAKSKLNNPKIKDLK
jgi:hypothetical protein